jgi:hypothetical protein
MSKRTINDGGPAFPSYASGAQGAACNTRFEPIGGMTLRDWFAGQAAVGLLASPNALSADDGTIPRERTMNMVAVAAYELADGMLAERSKQEDEK